MQHAETPPELARIIRAFEGIPHTRALGLRFLSLHRGRGSMAVDYDARLVGNPRTGVIHGGVITALLDTLCAAVVMASVPEDTPLATLDLRIDYLHPATPGETIRASAECYKVTANVAFVRGLAYHETIDEPIANCTGAFMLGATGFSTVAADGHGVAGVAGETETQRCRP